MSGVLNLIHAFRSLFSLERLFWALIYYIMIKGAFLVFLEFQVEILGNDVSYGGMKQSNKK